MTVQSDNTGLIGLCNIGKDDIHHSNQHAVLHGVTGVLNDGNYIRPLLSHIDEITAGTVRELDGVNVSGGSDDIGDVRDGGSGSSTDVQDLRAGLNVDIVQTTENTGSDLGTERIPDTVLDFGWYRLAILVSARDRRVNSYALLAVNGLARSQIAGDQHVLLRTGNEDTLVAMLLDNDFGAAPCSSSSTTTTATPSTAAAISTTSSTTATSTPEPTCSCQRVIQFLLHR
jgi:hypothetical protein